LSKSLKVLISGASGFLGSSLSSYLVARGHSLSSLVREGNSVPENTKGIFWNPHGGKVSLHQLNGLDAIIHLAGANISHGRWNSKKKKVIFLSRVRDTWLLTHVLTRLKYPPALFFSASAVGYYGNRGDQLLTEDSSPPSKEARGFLSELCVQWERATEVLETCPTRVVRGRFGVVLSERGGIISQLLPIFKLGCGAVLGKGTQWMSWIALEDFLRAVEFTLHCQELRGAVNFTSPYPSTQREFTQTLAQAVHRFSFLSLPSWFLRLAYGEKSSELLLISQRVIPQKLLNTGFIFSQDTLLKAFRHLK